MTDIPIKIQFVKTLSTAQPSRIVAVKADGDTAFSLWITDKTGIPYPLKDLQNNVIITNTDGNLQITTSSTSTNINLASSILTTINSALQSGDNISELVNDEGYLTTFTETDPIFQASEASLFVSGDKSNLDNQSGVNSGDQTSIVGITGTKAQFNTSLTDGDFVFTSDIIETAQDAVGTILIDSSTIDMSYDDATPSISASVKPNSITATELADTINISEFVNDSSFETTTQLNIRDTNNRARANHTGVQAISTITNLQGELDSKINLTEKATANGVATLDGNGKVPLSQLNDAILSNVKWKGLYNGSVISSSPDPSLNGTTLPIPSSTNEGWYFIANADFTYSTVDYRTGDWIISNGIIWDKVDNTDAVSTVFGRVGNVTAQNGDYDTSLVPETIDKRYQTDNQDLYNDATSSIQTQINSKEPNITPTGNITDFWSGNKTFRDLAADVRNVVLTGFNSVITWARVTTSTTIQNAVSLLQKQSDYLQATRFISGVGVTVNADPTKFDIQVVGEIVDPITFAPTTINVNLTAQTTTFLATQPESYVWINSLGVVIQSLTPPIPTDFDYIVGYWVLVHSNLTSITTINSFPIYADGVNTKVSQILSFIGFAKYPNTNIPTAGTTGTRFSHTGGFAIKSGLGNTTKRPILSLIGATDPSNMEMRHRGGTFTTGVQNIDVTNYNPTGNTVSPLANNKYGVHKIWKFASGLIRFQYSQYEKASYAEAVTSINIDNYVDEGNAFRNGLHIGWLVFKKGTSWGTGGTGIDGVDYKFIDVKSNGSVGGITPTLQAAYDVSTQPQITTNATKGAVDFKRGSDLDTDNVIRILNGAGVSTLSATGNGDITALSFIKTGGSNADVLRGDGDAYPVSSGDVIAGLGYIPVNSLRNINTTSPILGGGNLTADRTISIQQATTSQNGYLSSTDWNSFNNKITNQAHTGDATGSTALTLAIVNSNVGTFGNASNVAQSTVNAKGLTTAIANVPIQITESQVTGLVSDLANKQDVGATHFIGTTSIANNRASGAQTLTGVNIDGNSATTTLASNSTLWKGLTYNNLSPTTSPLYFMASADGGTYGYTPIADAQNALGLNTSAYQPTSAFIQNQSASAQPADMWIAGGIKSNLNLELNRSGLTASTPIRFSTNGTNDWFIGQSPLGASTKNLSFYSYGTNSTILELNQTSGAATFGSTITTGDNIFIPAGKYFGFSSTAYMTPEDNIQGARIKTLGGIILESSGDVRITDLSGTGTRTVVADASGVLSATNTLSDLSLTGNPTAPTATVGTNTTQIATTAFVLANGGASSGTYTPTLTNLVNCSSLTVASATYMKVGNIVNVMIYITGTITANTTATSLDVSLPVNRSGSSSIPCGNGGIFYNSNFTTFPANVTVITGNVARLAGISPGAGAGGGGQLTLSFQYDVTN